MLKTYRDYVLQAAKPKPKIKTLYGKHNYDSRNQKEYDAVIKIAKSALIGVENGPYAQTPIAEQAFTDFLDGAKPITDRNDPNLRSPYNAALLYADSALKEFRDSGMSKEDIIKYWRVQYAYASTSTGIDPETGAPQSAYDALVLGVTDCDAYSQVANLFFDIMGYNTAVLGRPGHAYAAVKINEEWRNSTTFRVLDINDYRTHVGGEYIISAPTKGY